MLLDARILARALGGHVTGRDTVSAPGPGHSPKDRSLSIRLDPRAPDGFLTHSHAGQDWRTCRDYVRSKIGLGPWQPGDGQNRRVALTHVRHFDRAMTNAESERHERSEDDLRRMRGAIAIWNQGIDPRNTLAEIYLRQHRKLDLPKALYGIVLRFHPACPWRDENTGSTIYLPALLAAFTSIDDDALTAIERIALTAEGAKIGRRMLGLVHRAAVKLDPLGDVLAVGEGVETCLAARQLGYAPAWATGSVGAISRFPVIDSVKRLRVLGETGAASADAFRHIGSRWHAAGHEVELVMPSVGSDLNDELMAATA